VRNYNAGLKCTARGSLEVQDPKNRHLRTIAQLCRAMSSQLRHVSTIGKKLLHSNISAMQMPHNMANFGPLTAEIGWRVWGIPANFNRFRVLALLLQRRRSPEANKTLHDGWPSPGLVRCVYMLGAFAPNGILQGANFTLSPSFAFSYIGIITAQHSTWASAKLCDVVQGMELRNFRRRRHLYSAGRPSRWASAHILVSEVATKKTNSQNLIG